MGFFVMKYGGGRYTSVAWYPTHIQAVRELIRIRSAGSWQGMPPMVEPDDEEKSLAYAGSCKERDK